MKLLEKYFQPTPKNLRKLGDTLLIIGSTITGYGISTDNHFLSYTSLVLTVLGKILTNFFTEE